MSLIFYCRVSSKDQNLDRQLARATQVHADKIFQDKQSGKNMKRPAMQAMKNYLREGDTLQVVSLDRISRDYQDLKDFVSWLQKNGIKLIVDDLPKFNTGDKLLDQFMMDMIIRLMGFVAQNEREKIRERQAQGIKIAQAKGLYKGGKIKYGPHARNPKNRMLWRDIINMLFHSKNAISISEIARKTGLGRAQIYRIKDRYLNEKNKANKTNNQNLNNTKMQIDKGVYANPTIRYSPYGSERKTWQKVIKMLNNKVPVQKIKQQTGLGRAQIYRIKDKYNEQKKYERLKRLDQQLTQNGKHWAKELKIPKNKNLYKSKKIKYSPYAANALDRETWTVVIDFLENSKQNENNEDISKITDIVGFSSRSTIYRIKERYDKQKKISK